MNIIIKNYISRSFQENSDKLFELAYLAYRHNDLENAEKYLKLCISNNNFESEFY